MKLEQTDQENINRWIPHLVPESKVAISVDCVIFGYDEEGLKILVMKSDMPPFEGKFSLVGDLLKDNETLDDSAQRVLLQRTGLEDVYLEQVHTFSDIERHPLGRVITVAYYSLVKLDDRLRHLIQKDLAVDWINIEDVNDMAFDHYAIMHKCLDTLRVRLREKPIGFNLLPKKFSMKQLQELYEVVLNVKLDKRNFRRKLRSLDILVDEKENQQDVAHRPAKLYSFDHEKYRQRKTSGFSFEL